MVGLRLLLPGEGADPGRGPSRPPPRYAVCDAVTDRTGLPISRLSAGRGTRQRIMPNAYGVARGHRPRRKRAFGFRTGAPVRAEVPSNRVAIRTTGSFNTQTPDGTVQRVSHRHCRLPQSGDGYGYAREVQP